MPRRLPKYVQAFVDRRNHQPRHYFRRKGYPLTALPGLLYTPEFMSAYGNALASSEELITKAKGERPARSVQPVAKVVPGSMAALIRDFKAARFPELGEVTQDNYTRLLNRLEKAAGPLPVAKITEADIQRLGTTAGDFRFRWDCVAKLENTASTKISRKGVHRQFWLEIPSQSE